MVRLFQCAFPLHRVAMYFLNGRDQLPNITRNAFSGLLLIASIAAISSLGLK